MQQIIKNSTDFKNPEMLHKLVMIFSLFFFVFAAYGQKKENTGTITSGETVELIQGDFIEFDIPVINDVVQIQQIGNKNDLKAIQQLDDQNTYILTTEQVGNKNIGFIEQRGSNHESLLIQRGNSNVANMWSVGINTQNRIYQDGNNNSVDSYMENYLSVMKSTTSYQEGNNNLIYLNFLSGKENSTPFGLLIGQEGTGNMADVMIDNYNVPYMKIEQTGGAKVIIHNSDFNYPVK